NYIRLRDGCIVSHVTFEKHGGYKRAISGGESASTGSWDPESDAAEGSKFDIQSDQTLVVRQAVLGAKAKPDELNIVEVSVMGFNKNMKIPVIRLKIGEQTQCRLDLTFPDPPVTFTLVEGSGPVHICGNIGVASGPLNELEEEEDEVDDDLDEEEDENAEESEDDLQNKAGEKKRKVAANANGKNKKIKLEEINDNEGDEEDEIKKKKLAAGKKDKLKKQKDKKSKMLACLPLLWNVRKIMKEFNAPNYKRRQSSRKWKNKRILETANRKWGNSLSPEIAEAVKLFYESDEIIRVLLEIMDCVSVRSENGEKVIKKINSFSPVQKLKKLCESVFSQRELKIDAEWHFSATANAVHFENSKFKFEKLFFTQPLSTNRLLLCRSSSSKSEMIM
ncbi:nucleoplasmin-like protein ANO39 isoform X1, partial [Gryllus bimaculatus]